MESKPGFDWVRTAALIFCAAAGVALLYLSARYLLGILLPFIIGAAVAAAVTPLADRITAAVRLPRRLVAGGLVLILLATVIFLLFLGVRRLISELSELASQISEQGSAVNDLIGSAIDFVEGIGERLPASVRFGNEGRARDIGGEFESIISTLIDEVVTAISRELPGILSAILSLLPSVFLAIAVSVLAAFFIALDRDRVMTSLAEMLPSGIRGRLPHIKKEAALTAVKYLRAYSLILLITFSELFLGFSLMGKAYSFLLALVIAVIDILPVFGVGIALLPWAAISFITGDVPGGIGLCVLYGVVLIVRQLIEPKIVGESLGIHPLLTLFAMYVGYRLIGVPGMLLGPLAVPATRMLYGIVSDKKTK